MPTQFIPEFTAPTELRRDVMTAREVASAAASTAASVWEANKHVVLTAIIAGIVARYIGRPVAKIENTVIGGIAAGFSAYRDPRDALWKQLLVAVGYGASWGLTDVYVPIILNYFSRAGEQPVGEPELEAAVANGGDSSDSISGWRRPRRRMGAWRSR